MANSFSHSSGLPPLPGAITEIGGPDKGLKLIEIRGAQQISRIEDEWLHMLSGSRSPEKLYQTPAFFRYLEETTNSWVEPVSLFLVTRDGASVGIVPVRIRRQPVEFRAGVGSVRWHLTVVQLLGSVPVLADEPALAPWLMQQLLEHFPQAGAVSMQAMPQELSGQYRALPGLRTYVMDGWRDCHTIALPASFDQYLAKFSAKKRYNLTRQVRLLAKEAGPAALARIERPEQVGALFAALRGLMPPRDFARFPEQYRFERLAANGLLLSYVLACNGEHVGAIVATYADRKWLVHNIFCAKKYQHLSAGTSTLHLALEDLITHVAPGEADFGYGTPNRDFRSTHVLKSRGHVLVYRARGLARLVLGAHAGYARLYEALATRARQLRGRLGRWRAARQLA